MAKDTLKVSIITPSYNQGQFIERTILSVLEQDYPNIEYIVIDGGSTDNTLEILKKYENRLIWKSEPDKGQSDAVNKGFRMATGEIIGWLNSDDVYRPGAIRIVVEYFLEHPEVDMVYGECDYIDEFDKSKNFYHTENFNLKRYINAKDIIPQQSSFYRKRILDKVGLLDINLNYAMDFDLFIRIGKNGIIKRIPFHLASFRSYVGQKSRFNEEVYKAFYREVLFVSRRYGGNPWRRLLNQKIWTLRRVIIRQFPWIRNIVKFVRKKSKC
ncbi:MAG: glycosyltransferase family 2 protein [Candidatus Helarchaeota archaeon]